MKISTVVILFVCFYFQCVIADDGKKQMFTHVEMNINNDNYILFEDNSLIVCDRYNDEYIVDS